MHGMSIRLATSDDEILACHPVMAQLRPHVPAADFVTRVRRQQEQGYRLAALHREAHVVAVAGYRLGENLSAGRHLYVDDLVTDAGLRSAGHGGALFDWLVGQARAAGCAALLLDSGVQRHAAHRFYLARRLEIRSHHFVLPLGAPA
jgi:GNAT superfamily N-acetyltransferase